MLSSNQIKNLGLNSNQEIHDYLVILNSKLFYFQFYKNTYDLDDSVNFVAHYITTGVKKGFNPNSAFDTNYYLNLFPNSKMNPFAHYLKFGRFANIIPKKFTLKDLLNLNLKKTIKGKNDFLFLINDVANELRQHFDMSYKNKFNVNDFLDEYYFKKLLFKKNNIDYFYFVIPDKSIVCKNFLPFEVNYIKRNVDEVNEIIDFVNNLNNTCYYKLDTHVNRKGAEILSFLMLNYMDNEFTIKEWNNLMNINVEDNKQPRDWDLLSDMNWSFSDKERRVLKDKYSDYFEFFLKPINSKDLHDDIPEFLSSNKRPTFFTINQDSFSDKRVLIFRDSSFWIFKPFFSHYFKEMCIFWDHGSLDERIINFYKPDVIIEARTERYIDILYKSDWVQNKKNIFLL